MNSNFSSTKSYISYSLLESTSIFEGYVEFNNVNYFVDINLIKKLAKSLGFSHELYLTLSSYGKEAASAMVHSMSKQSGFTDIVLLLDDKECKVLGYSLESDRLPLLNKEFLHRVKSLSETSDAITISEIYIHEEDTISSIILKKSSPIVIEEKYENKESKMVEYDIGIMLVNDELNSVYSRLVLYVEGQPLYLPSSYYNSTASRYKRSTSSTSEALEVLVLKIIEDLRDNVLYNKLYDFHYRYRVNQHVLASYEEYNTILRTVRRIPTIIEDNSFLEKLMSRYEDFEKKYAHLEDKKSSYIWRCTALSDFTVGALVSITVNILCDLSAPPVEYFEIRDLLGSYISTNRIAEEIAREEIN